MKSNVHLDKRLPLYDRRSFATMLGLHGNGHTFRFTNHNIMKGVAAKAALNNKKAVYSSRTDGETYQSFLLMTLGLSVHYGVLNCGISAV